MSAWYKQFDPNSQSYYYYNSETLTSQWEEPPTFSAGGLDETLRSATRIQCAFRVRRARRASQWKATSTKQLADLSKVSVDLLETLTQLQLTPEESKRFPIESERFQLFKTSHASMTDKIQTCSTDDMISRLRKSFIQLISSVNEAADQHVRIDGYRVNNAWEQIQKVKSDPMYAIKTFEHRNLVNQDLLLVKVQKAETALRKAMGLTGFKTGKAKITNVKFNEWHGVVKIAVRQVNEVSSFVQRSYEKIAVVTEEKRAKRERKQMQKEERELKKFLFAEKKDEIKDKKQMELKSIYRRAWARGMNLKKNDFLQDCEVKTLKDEIQKQNELDLVKRSAKARYDWTHRTGLSIWQAVKEGCTIQILENLIKEENQRGESHGSTPFRLHDPHPHTGETLIQVACWYGHAHLVQYFITKGANVGQADCLSNQFTLLHGAARVGAAEIIKLLIDSGLSPDVKDTSGDSPLHWAVRSNNVEATCAILKSDPIDSKGMSPVWKCLSSRNNRGRTPLDLAEVKKFRVLVNILLQYEIKLQTRRCQDDSGAHHLNVLRKAGRKQGREAVVKNLKDKSTVQQDDESLIGSASAQSGQIAEIRRHHFRNKKMLATGIQSFPQQVRKDVAARAGNKWKEKIQQHKL